MCVMWRWRWFFPSDEWSIESRLQKLLLLLLKQRIEQELLLRFEERIEKEEIFERWTEGVFHFFSNEENLSHDLFSLSIHSDTYSQLIIIAIAMFESGREREIHKE